MQFDSFCFTGAGGRAYNEDACAERRFPGGGLWAVADGLGGTQRGEQAAALTVAALTDAPPPEDAAPGKWLGAQLEAAQAGILALQAQTRGNMKSTAAALLIRDRMAVWAHVGDSRVYYFHDRALTKVTEDHSVAFKKYKSGQIARWEIGQDPDQSALLRALGNPERYQPEFDGVEELCAGDAFLLCSDGVWEYLHDGEILVDRLKAATARDWGTLLLARVMDRIPENNDNLSLITLILHEEDQTS